MAKKDLLKERIVYKPFEYPEAFDYWLKQQQAHWIHTEVPMMSDVNDWKQNLTETEKNIIGSILKGFAQTETVVNDYWTGLVTKWFRKPEIIAMATTFGAMETIHAEAYSLLNEGRKDIWSRFFHTSDPRIIIASNLIIREISIQKL